MATSGEGIHKRKNADHARLTVTLNFTFPKSYRDEFPTPTRLDAMNILREIVEEIGDTQDRHTLGVNLNRLLNDADSVSLDVGR